MLLGDEDRNKKIIDVGCGKCDLFDLLVSSGWDIDNLYGADESESAINICRGKGYRNLLHSQIQDIEESYDLAVSIDVLEHIADPDRFFEKLKGVAKEIILVVPNFSSWKQRVQAIGGTIPFQNRLARGGHVLWLNYPYLKELFANHDLNVLDERHLFSKSTGDGAAAKISYGFQKRWPNLFAHAFGFRLSK